MIDTWRDSWFEEGMRIFYILPRKAVDGVLPLKITPSPAPPCGSSSDASKSSLRRCGSLFGPLSLRATRRR